MRPPGEAVPPARNASSSDGPGRTFVLRPERIFVWATFCLVWTILTPGLIAYRRRVFTSEEVRAAAAARPGCVADPDCIRRISLKREAAPGQTRSEPEGVAPRAVFLGFFESRTTYAYCAATFALGVLAWWSGRRLSTRRLFVVKSARIGFLLWGVWGGLSVIRGLALGDIGRTIFSFVHPDIDFAEFVLQELRSLLLCFLVGYIWLAHDQLAVQRNEGIRSRDTEGDIFDPMKVYLRAVDVGGLFDDWQIDSILLAAGFFPWTIYYWSLDHRWGDTRYYVSTLVWHLVWGLSWWTVSSSVLSAWREFNHYRARMQASLIGSADARPKVEPGRSSVDEVKARREYVAEQMQWIASTKPVSTTHLVLAAVASIVTFLLPLLKAVR